jgi:voltage-gated potassium channel
MTFIDTLRELYEKQSSRAHAFRYALLAMDIATLLFLIISSFFYGHPIVEHFDLIFGIYITLDFISRFTISNKKIGFLIKPYSIIDMMVILSFMAPILGQHFAFLRAVAMFRLLRSYLVLKRLREDFEFFRRHEDTVLSALNLFLFIFIMTELVFQSQVGTNPNIKNFIDAMYFTITTLTTTGFGDITLQGSMGRGLSIIIMIFGVSLFVRLIQTLFRPNKVRFSCPSCGLFLHDRDAVHCKHCGVTLNIPDEGIA